MTAAAVTCFGFEDHLVRVIMQDDDPWFVAMDVCRVLGIQNPARAADRLDDDEKGIRSTYTLGGEQDVAVISESGLYTLILRCRSATTPGSPAHRFRRWVTGEVLPQIRKTGQYAPIGTNGTDNRSQSVAEERLKLDKIHYVLRGFGPVAMRALWKQLGLDWVPEMELVETLEPARETPRDLSARVLDFIAANTPVTDRDVKRKFKTIREMELREIIRAGVAADLLRVTKTYPPGGGRASIVYEFIGEETVISVVTPSENGLN